MSAVEIAAVVVTAISTLAGAFAIGHIKGKFDELDALADWLRNRPYDPFAIELTNYLFDRIRKPGLHVIAEEKKQCDSSTSV